MLISIGNKQNEFPIVIKDEHIEFPKLIYINKLGKEVFWQIFIKLYKNNSEVVIDESLISEKLSSDYHAEHYVESGHITGKIRKAVPTKILIGKNIGKINETNVLLQAIINSNSLYNKQKKLSETKSIVDGLAPMLAYLFKEHRLTKYSHIQHKLNGIRAIYNNQEMRTRTKKLLRDLEYITNKLSHVPKNIYLDGELYIHGQSLQKINQVVSLLMNLDGDEVPELKLEYHIFDIVNINKPILTFEERYKWITENIIEDDIIKIVFTKKVVDWNVDQYHECLHEVLKLGYEGIMIRNSLSRYEIGTRTYNLMKMKPVLDDEFKVTGIVITDKGKTDGAFIFECITSDNLKFNVTPSMTIQERKELVQSGEVNKYIGKKITVYYDELSDDNVPLRGRSDGIIRDEVY